MPMRSFVHTVQPCLFHCVSLRIPRQQEQPKKARGQARTTASSQLIVAHSRILLRSYSTLLRYMGDDPKKETSPIGCHVLQRNSQQEILMRSIGALLHTTRYMRAAKSPEVAEGFRRDGAVGNFPRKLLFLHPAPSSIKYVVLTTWPSFNKKIDSPPRYMFIE